MNKKNKKIKKLKFKKEVLVFNKTKIKDD